MAKSFKNILSEVAQPKAGEEKNFKNMHMVQKRDYTPYPGQDHVFNGTTKKMPRLADLVKGEDEDRYDPQYDYKRVPGEYTLGEKVECPKCEGEGCDHCDDKGYHDDDVKDESRRASNAKALDKATSSSEAGKKAVTLAKAPWDKKDTAKKLKEHLEHMEALLELEEAFTIKPSTMSLGSGEKVKVAKADAALLTQFFKDLNPRNQKEMRKVLEKDKNGYEEILGFAREAL